MRAWLVVVLAVAGCLVDNPAWLGMSGDETSSADTSGGEPTTGPSTTAESTTSTSGPTGSPTSATFGTSETGDDSTGSSGSSDATGWIFTGGSETGEPPEDGLVAYYPMTVNAKGELEDLGPHGLHGVCSEGEAGDACPLDIEGIDGRAQRFEGGTVYLVDDDPRLRLNRFTISLWARHEMTDVCGVYLGKPVGKAEKNSFETGFCPNHISATVSQGDFERQAIGNTTFGDWVHVAATFDGNIIAIYIGGERLGANADVLLVPDYDEAPLIIGGDRDGGVLSNFLVGAIDEVRIYNYPLSEEEIAALAAI